MGLPTSNRQLALTDLVARLGYIQVAKGYNTDAGLSIFEGEKPRLGPDDVAAAISVFFGDDTAETGGGLTRYQVPIEIWGLIPVKALGDLSPGQAIEALRADIMSAVELNEGDPSHDRYLGVIDGTPKRPATLPKGLARGGCSTLQRQDGSDHVGVVVRYIASFEEAWGQP